MQKIGTIDEFPEGRGTKVDVDGIEIAVFNLDGDLYGISNLCPHRRLPLHRAGEPKRRPADEVDEDVDTIGEVDPEEGCIRCPWHRLEFDLESGVNSQTDQQVGTFDVEVDGDEVFVEI